MRNLELNDLSQINQRLQKCNKPTKLLETLAEHSLAVELLKNKENLSITYEPSNFNKPPDFHVKSNDIDYYLEVKRPAKLELDNRQEKILQTIKTQAKEIKVDKYFNCFLSTKLDKAHLDEFMSFIQKKANIDCGMYEFVRDNSILARLEFFMTKDNKHSHLTFCSGGDLAPINIIGLSKTQIKSTMRNAVKKFKNQISNTLVNLIILEVKSGGGVDIDICEAAYGTEIETFRKNAWFRNQDGLFNVNEFSEKVAGIIVRARKDPNEIICNDYLHILCVNEKFINIVSVREISKVLEIDKVFHYNERPCEGFFGLA